MCVCVCVCAGTQSDTRQPVCVSAPSFPVPVRQTFLSQNMAAHHRGANGPVVSVCQCVCQCVCVYVDVCVCVCVCLLLPTGMKSRALKKESIALVAD